MYTLYTLSEKKKSENQTILFVLSKKLKILPAVKFVFVCEVTSILHMKQFLQFIGCPRCLVFHTCTITSFWITSSLISLNPCLSGWCFKLGLRTKFPFMQEYVPTWHDLTWSISIFTADYHISSSSSSIIDISKGAKVINDFLPICNAFYFHASRVGRCRSSNLRYLSFWEETLYPLCLILLPNPVRLTVLYLPLAIKQRQLNMWQAWEGINKD